MYNIEKEFSSEPRGRFIKDSKFSGEAFYNVLEELYFNDKHIKINLDGTYGFTNGFLYQSFGKFKETHMDVIFTFESYEIRSLPDKIQKILDTAEYYIQNKDYFYNMSKEFTATPTSRFKKNSLNDTIDVYSGEAFRDILIQLYHGSKHIKIDISGLNELPPGFAEESFGGLAQMYPKAILHIRSDKDLSYIDDINRYVNVRRNIIKCGFC